MDRAVPDPQPGERAPFRLADLQRWEDHGATWRTLQLDDAHTVLQLCTCHGEPVDVVRGAEPGLLAFVRARRDAPGSD